MESPSLRKKIGTFQGHLAPVTSVEQVETVMDALLRNRKFAGATHNIMAYRIAVPEKNTVLQDSDDDGENAAGGRLLHLLQIVDALNVVCHFPWTLVFSSSCSSPHSRRQKKEQMQSASTKRVMSSTLGVIVMRMLMP
jgi:hypothetical protein